MDQQVLNKFRAYLERIAHYEKVNSLLFWDSMQKVPPKGAVGRAATKGAMAEETMRLQTSEELKGYIDALTPHAAELSDMDRALLRVSTRAYNFYQKVPPELFRAHESTKGEAIAIWDRVMRTGEYGELAPYLDTLIEQNKRMAECFGYSTYPYDALVDYYEEGMNCQTLDHLFGELKEAIIPLVQKVSAKGVKRPEFLNAFVPKEVQARFNERLYRRMGVDPEAAILCETTHPFSFTINIRDIRFSTRYFENDFSSSLFSVLHEGGHCINSLNIPDEVESTILGGGTSAAFQESQSRFYENVIGRSRAFWEAIYDDFMSDFRPYIGEVTVDDLYRAFNYSAPSFIRTAADELTYNLHIILRYELERDFINGDVKAAQLPELWNQKIHQYLGLTVPNNQVGILQDIQWPYGRYGAFVSYSLGNVYNLQILKTMEKDFDVFGSVRGGDFETLKRWLGEHVHQYSQIYTPNELLRRITGEDLNPKPFINYLTDKMTEIYDL